MCFPNRYGIQKNRNYESGIATYKMYLCVSRSPTKRIYLHPKFFNFQKTSILELGRVNWTLVVENVWENGLYWLGNMVLFCEIKKVKCWLDRVYAPLACNAIRVRAYPRGFAHFLFYIICALVLYSLWWNGGKS